MQLFSPVSVYELNASTGVGVSRYDVGSKYIRYVIVPIKKITVISTIISTYYLNVTRTLYALF